MSIKDMLGRTGVASREEAFKLLQERFVVPELAVEEVALAAALGRVLAIDLTAPSDLPEFDRSTMDGYAVSSSDTFGAAESRPALLQVVGDIPMGTMPDRILDRGQTMKIATGGALPRQADSVVMFEQTQAVDEATIEVVKPVGPLENVIRRGEDIRKGEIFLNRGRRLRPQDLAALAGVGITGVTVYERPKVGLLSTGNEIVPAQSIPGPGQIRDSNSYNLEGLVTLAGGAPVRRGIIPDDYEQLRTAVHSAVGECGMVLMTGGSSVGTADLSAKVINEAGSPGVLVHGVAIKPGKPLIIGLAGSVDRPVPIFGLPGHPAAVTLCFELFVRPILTRLTGEVPHPALEGIAPERSVKARLARSISSAPGREEHVRVMLERREDGLWARPVFGASGLITTLVKALGTVVIPVNRIGIEAGEEVDVVLF
jgi:molybdopterin molybdotransferase